MPKQPIKSIKPTKQIKNNNLKTRASKAIATMAFVGAAFNPLTAKAQTHSTTPKAQIERTVKAEELSGSKKGVFVTEGKVKDVRTPKLTREILVRSNALESRRVIEKANSEPKEFFKLGELDFKYHLAVSDLSISSKRELLEQYSAKRAKLGKYLGENYTKLSILELEQILLRCDNVSQLKQMHESIIKDPTLKKYSEGYKKALNGNIVEFLENIPDQKMQLFFTKLFSFSVSNYKEMDRAFMQFFQDFKSPKAREIFVKSVFESRTKHFDKTFEYSFWSNIIYKTFKGQDVNDMLHRLFLLRHAPKN